MTNHELSTENPKVRVIDSWMELSPESQAILAYYELYAVKDCQYFSAGWQTALSDEEAARLIGAMMDTHLESGQAVEVQENEKGVCLDTADGTFFIGEDISGGRVAAVMALIADSDGGLCEAQLKKWFDKTASTPAIVLWPSLQERLEPNLSDESWPLNA